MKQKSVFILGDAYFNTSEEHLIHTITSLHQAGFTRFYVTNGCDFDRLAIKVLHELFLRLSDLRIVLSSRSTMLNCLENSSIVVTGIDSSQLVKDDIGLDDHPILFTYNNLTRFNLEIVNLAS